MANRPIDEKIVKLAVDNKDFSNKLKQSVEELGQFSSGAEKATKIDASPLKKFTEAIGNGIDKITSKIPILGTISSHFSSSGKSAEDASTKVGELGASVEQTSNHFSILAGAAAVALGNIAEKAIETGAEFVKSWTLEPITEGFHTYETEMQTVQTMLSNQEGETKLSAVQINNYVRDLDNYASKTTYQFSDLVTTMSKMTTAGVSVSDAEKATEGFSNACAAAGVDQGTMAQASYDLTEAMDQGALGARQMRSVLGMSGIVSAKFKETMIETANAVNGSNYSVKDWNAALKDGAINTKVMTQALKTMADDKSLLSASQDVKTFSQAIEVVKSTMGAKWSQVWQGLIGNFDQAKSLWTGVTSAITAQIQTTMNKLILFVEEFNTLGGRQNVIDGLANVFKALGTIIDAVKAAFHDIFPPANVKNLVAMTAEFKKFTATLIPSATTVSSLRAIFDILFTVLRAGVTVIGAIVKALTIFITPIKNLVGAAVNIVGAFAKVLNIFRALGDASGVGSKSVSGFNFVLSVLSTVLNTVTGAIDTVTQVISSLTGVVSDYAIKGIQILHGWIIIIEADIKKWITSFINLAANTNIGQKAISIYSTVLSNVSKVIKEAKDGFEGFNGSVGKVGTNVKKTFNEIKTDILSFVAGLTNIKPATEKAGSAILALGKHVQNDLKSPLTTAQKNLEKFGATCAGIGLVVGNGIAVGFKTAVNWISQMTNGTKVFASTAGKDFSSVGGKVGAAFNTISKGVSAMMTALAPVAHQLTPLFQAMGKAIKDFLNNINTDAIFKGGLIAGLTLLYAKLKGLSGPIQMILHPIQTLKDLFTSKIGGKEDANNLLKSVQETLEGYQKKLKAGIILEIAGAVGILAVSIKLLSTIPAARIGTSLGAVTISLASCVKALQAINKLDMKNSDVAKNIALMLGIAISLDLLGSAMRKITAYPWQQSIVAVGSITVLMAAMTGMVTILNKTAGKLKEAKPTIVLMIGISASMYVMAMGVKKLANLQPQSLAQGLVGFVTVMAAMQALMQSLNNMEAGSVTKESAITLGVIALSMGRMASSIKKLGGMPFASMVQGLAAIGLMFNGFITLSKELDGVDSMKAAVTIAAMAVSMNLLVVPILALGHMSLNTLTLGLSSMAIAIAELGIAGDSMNGDAESAAVILAFALALNMLIVPIEALGHSNWVVLAVGLGSVAVALGLFIAAGWAATAVAPGLMLLATVMGAFSLSMTVTALALPALAIGIGLLVAAFVGAGVTIAKNAKTIVNAFTIIGSGIALALPRIVVAIIQGLVSGLLTSFASITKIIPTLFGFFTTALMKILPDLVKDLDGVLLALLQVIVDVAPALIQTVIDLLNDLIVALTKNLPTFVQNVITLIITAINTLADAISKNTLPMLQAGGHLALALLQGLGTIVVQLGKVIWSAIQAIPGIIIGFLGMVGSAAGKLGSAILNAIKNLPNGFLKTVLSAGVAVVTGIGTAAVNGGKAALGLASKVISGIGGIVSGAVDAAGKFVSSIGTGLAKAATSAFNAVKAIPGEIAKGIGDLAKKGASIAGDFVKGLGDGIKNGVKAIADAVGSLGSSMVKGLKGLLGIKSPSRVARGIGEFFSQGLAIGISNLADQSTSAALDMGNKAVAAVKSSVQRVNEAVQNGFSTNSPKITPIIDTTNMSIPEIAKNMRTAITAAGNANIAYGTLNAAVGQNDSISFGDFTFTFEGGTPGDAAQIKTTVINAVKDEFNKQIRSLRRY